MIEAAREAVSFARGRVRDDLETDRQLLLSLVKDIEIVGEAASQITDSTRKELTTIPGPVLSQCETGLSTPISASTSISFGKPYRKTYQT